MKTRKVRVAVIGAGSAGLSVFREAQKATDDTDHGAKLNTKPY